MLLQTRPSSFHGVEKPFLSGCYAAVSKTIKLMAGPLPNIPCHGSADFAALKFLFVLMFRRLSTAYKWTAARAPTNTVQLISQCWVNFSSEWRDFFQKHSKFRLGRASPNTAQFLSRCWRTFSCGCYAAFSKTFKLMAGPRSPNILCHGPAHFTALNIFSFWCYANSQQRSNERLVVLLQARSSSNHGVESTFRPDGMKLFKNIPVLIWVVLLQTRPSSFHDVEKLFRLDVMQPFQKHSSWWLGRVPQHPLSRPSSFHGGKHGYRFDVMQTFNNVQMNGWSWSPKHGPAQFTVLSHFFVRMAWSFSKTFEILDWSCSPKHGPILFTVLKNLFVWVFCSHFKNIQVDGWAALPNIPCHGPAHFTALNKFFFWCYADFHKRSNERLVVLPQTRSSSIHGVESTFRPDGVKLFKNIQNLGWVVLTHIRPSSFHGVEEPFRLDIMQPFQKHSNKWLGCASQHPLSRPNLFRGVKLSFRFDVMQTFNSVQMNGWSCSPKHDPAHITLLSQLFVRMAWSFSKTFKL